MRWMKTLMEKSVNLSGVFLSPPSLSLGCWMDADVKKIGPDSKLREYGLRGITGLCDVSSSELNHVQFWTAEGAWEHKFMLVLAFIFFPI